MAKKLDGNILGRIADLVLIVVAVTMAAFYVSGSRPSRGGNSPSRKEAPASWRDEVSTGIRVGPTDAPVTIIEFMDLQCPFCALWAMRVDSLRREYPAQVQVVFHHFPLPSHAHALTAAGAAECAHQQGRFAEFTRAVLEQQDKMGGKPWRDFAIESGVADVKRFDRCADLPPDSFPRIAYGMNLGKRSNVTRTPTVWVNGVVGQLSLEELREMTSKARGSR